MSYRRQIPTGFALAVCDRCGSPVLDQAEAREVHDTFHAQIQALLDDATNRGLANLPSAATGLRDLLRP